MHLHSGVRQRTLATAALKCQQTARRPEKSGTKFPEGEEANGLTPSRVLGSCPTPEHRARTRNRDTASTRGPKPPLRSGRAEDGGETRGPPRASLRLPKPRNPGQSGPEAPTAGQGAGTGNDVARPYQNEEQARPLPVDWGAAAKPAASENPKVRVSGTRGSEGGVPPEDTSPLHSTEACKS